MTFLLNCRKVNSANQVKRVEYMKIRCVWEHNGEDTLLYADNFPGAFTRGASKEAALEKMQEEITSYQR